jgi:hypothetical protein
MTTAALALDPGIFSPDAIDPETTAFNAQLASLLADVPPSIQVACTASPPSTTTSPTLPAPASPPFCPTDRKEGVR